MADPTPAVPPLCTETPTGLACPVPSCGHPLTQQDISLPHYAQSYLHCARCLAFYPTGTAGLRNYGALSETVRTAVADGWRQIDTRRDAATAPTVEYVVRDLLVLMRQGTPEALTQMLALLMVVLAQKDGAVLLADAAKTFWPYFHGDDDTEDLSAVLLTDKTRPFYLDNTTVQSYHPLKRGNHDTYGAALCMVSERHSKGDLVLLVTALLERDRRFRARVEKYLGELPPELQGDD